MTISVVILAGVAILLFFGVVEKYFDRLGLTSWLAFLIIIALLIGTVTPDLSYASFRLTFGGFVFPLASLAVILGISIKKINVLRALSSTVIGVALIVILRIFIGLEASEAVLIVTVLSATAVGITAYLVADSRLGSVCACFGAYILGDLVWSAVSYAMDPTEFIIGGYGTLDGLVLSVTVSLVLAEIVYTVKNYKSRAGTKRTLDAEVSEDVTITSVSNEKTEKDEEDDRI